MHSQLFLFFKRAILIRPSAILLEHWACPNRSNSLDPELQNRNKCAPLGFTYLFHNIQGSWISRKPYGIKPRCYWEHLGEHIWEHFENLMGTREKTKNPCPPFFEKEKSGPFMSASWASSLAAWNFSFQNCWSPFFTLANGRGTNLGT